MEKSKPRAALVSNYLLYLTEVMLEISDLHIVQLRIISIQYVTYTEQNF